MPPGGMAAPKSLGQRVSLDRYQAIGSTSPTMTDTSELPPTKPTLIDANGVARHQGHELGQLRVIRSADARPPLQQPRLRSSIEAPESIRSAVSDLHTGPSVSSSTISSGWPGSRARDVVNYAEAVAQGTIHPNSQKQESPDEAESLVANVGKRSANNDVEASSSSSVKKPRGGIFGVHSGDVSRDGIRNERTTSAPLDNLDGMPSLGQKVCHNTGMPGIPGVQADQSVSMEISSQSSASLPESLEASAAPWPAASAAQPAPRPAAGRELVTVAAASGGGGSGNGRERGEQEDRMNGSGACRGNDQSTGRSSSAGGIAQSGLEQGSRGGGQHSEGGREMGRGDERGPTIGSRGYVILELKNLAGDALRVEFDGTHIFKEDLCMQAQGRIPEAQDGALRLWSKQDPSREYADGEQILSGAAVMVEIFKQVSDIDRRAKLPGLPESAQAPGVLTLAKGFELSAENRAYLEARDDKFIASAQLSGQLENAPKEVKRAFLAQHMKVTEVSVAQRMKEQQQTMLDKIIENNNKDFEGNMQAWMKSCFDECMDAEPKPKLATVHLKMASAFRKNIEKVARKCRAGEEDARRKAAQKIKKANDIWAKLDAGGVKNVGKIMDSDDEEDFIEGMVSHLRERSEQAAAGACKSGNGGDGKVVSGGEEDDAAVARLAVVKASAVSDVRLETGGVSGKDSRREGLGQGVRGGKDDTAAAMNVGAAGAVAPVEKGVVVGESSVQDGCLRDMRDMDPSNGDSQREKGNRGRPPKNKISARSGGAASARRCRDGENEQVVYPVGQMVEVLFEEDEEISQWYPGRVTKYNPGRKEPYDVYFQVDGQTIKTDIPHPDVRMVDSAGISSKEPSIGASHDGALVTLNGKIVTGLKFQYYEQIPSSTPEVSVWEGTIGYKYPGKAYGSAESKHILYYGPKGKGKGAAGAYEFKAIVDRRFLGDKLKGGRLEVDLQEALAEMSDVKKQALKKFFESVESNKPGLRELK